LEFVMPQNWLRLYREVIHDPKLARVPAEERWIWITLLCLSSDGGRVSVADGVGYEISDIARIADVTVDSVSHALGSFEKLGMVRVSSDRIEILKWKSRQYKSDTSTPRVRTFRDRQAKRFSNVSETDQNRAEQIQNRDRADTEKETVSAVASTAPRKKKVFVKPTREEVQAHLTSLGEFRFGADEFYSYYESKGWRIGKTPMVSWKSAVGTWVARANKEGKVNHPPGEFIGDGPTPEEAAANLQWYENHKHELGVE
jgi:hypothetical protein